MVASAVAVAFVVLVAAWDVVSPHMAFDIAVAEVDVDADAFLLEPAGERAFARLAALASHYSS